MKKTNEIQFSKEKPFKTGERPATNLKAQKAQFSRTVYYPRKNAVIGLIRSEPSQILADKYGRIYGLMPENPVLDDLRKSSEFNLETMVEVWVYLPHDKKGLFVDTSRKRKKYLLDGEVLRLPDVGESITLYNYVDGEKHASVVVHSFPERLFRNAKTTALVIRIEEFHLDKKRKIKKIV